jgi:CheY-like chemotaxis protein
LGIEKVRAKLNSACCTAYKVIFLDIEMPGMDGYATFKVLNEMKQNNSERMFVVACSGYSGAKEKAKALKCGMIDYLEKPLRKTEVENIIKKYLRG